MILSCQGVSMFAPKKRKNPEERQAPPPPRVFTEVKPSRIGSPLTAGSRKNPRNKKQKITVELPMSLCFCSGG